MAEVLLQKRTVFGDITNGGSELDGDEKHGLRVLHWLDVEFTETCEAPVCVCPQRLITDDDDAVICEGCATNTIYHAKCADIRPGQLPAKWWCAGCSAKKKAKRPRKRRTPEGGPRGPYPNEMPPDERAEYYKAKAEKKAKKKAEGADELEAAVSALKRTLAEKAWTPAKKAKYMAIVGEVKNWAKHGGTVLTAAKWIRRLVSEGKDRLTPSDVRDKYKKNPLPGAA
jgi:hypothetical protein